MTNIKKCTCKSEYQDEKYGKGMRVHNLCLPTPKGQECRCVVCNAKKPV